MDEEKSQRAEKVNCRQMKRLRQYNRDQDWREPRNHVGKRASDNEKFLPANLPSESNREELRHADQRGHRGKEGDILFENSNSKSETSEDRPVQAQSPCIRALENPLDEESLEATYGCAGERFSFSVCISTLRGQRVAK